MAPKMAAKTESYRPGLEGVVAGVTSISNIDAERNVLTYRGYNIDQLCEHATFEEVAYLLLYGELPNRPQLVEFVDWLISEREVPAWIYAGIRQLPVDSDPMDWLKMGVAALALEDPQAHDNSHDANLAKAVRLTAKMPTLLANGWRVLHGLEPTAMNPELGRAAHFLYLLSGEPADELHVRTLNATMILYAEHGFNASTFAARVTVSTLSDMHSGVVSAIGALKGPLHGGANEEVMRMLLEIGDASEAGAWVRKRLTRTSENPHPRIMGFGHREYKHGDQRAVIARHYTRELARLVGEPRWAAIQDALEEYMLHETGIHPNLDFPVSPAYYMMGLPIPLYTPIFVLARVVGWCAHVIEQLDNNRIIRPTSLYDGPPLRPYVPLSERR